jgi:hypothetical protein
MLVAVEVEGGMGIIIVMCHPDEVSDHVALVRAMAVRFEFTPEQ